MNEITPLVRFRTWARRNLFRSWFDGIVTVTVGSAAIYLAFRLLNYALITGRWEVVSRNLKLLLVGRFPDDELSTVAIAISVLALWGGLIAGLVIGRQRRAGAYVERTVTRTKRVRELLARFWPTLMAIAVLLSMSDTAGPWIAAGAIIFSAVVGRFLGVVVGRFLITVPTPVKLLVGLVMAAVPLSMRIAPAW